MYSSLNGLPKIAKVLKQVKQLGGKVAKFMKREFFSVTGLKFGVMSDIFLKTYHVISGGDENLQLKHVWKKFMVGRFEEPNDGLKMALTRFEEESVIMVVCISGGSKLLRSFSMGKLCVYDDNTLSTPRFPHVVLEVLTPTDDEKIQPYLVGVDTNLSEGPQFVPLNYDDGEQRPNDNGNDDGNVDGNDDDADIDVVIAYDGHANDGGQSRPKQMKRKMSPQKEKQEGRTKRTRTSRVMSSVGDDSTDSSRTIREVMNAMSKRFEDIMKKEIQNEVLVMERRINKRLDRVDKMLDDLVQPRHQITQTTPDWTPHSEPHRFDPNYSMPVHQNFESRRADNSQEVQRENVASPTAEGKGSHGGGDVTSSKGDGEGDARGEGGEESLVMVVFGSDHGRDKGIVGDDETDGEGLEHLVQNILAQEGLNVQTPSPLVVDRTVRDASTLEYLAVQNEREQRLKIKYRYMTSPYIDPIPCAAREKKKIESKAKLSEEWKKFQPSEDAPLSCEFDALKYKCSTDWILYAVGDKPWWGTTWSTVKHLLVPCAVDDPAGHWILCDVDLEKRSVCIYDPLYKTTNIHKRVKQITPLLRLIPAILQASGYFDKRGIAPDEMMFVVEQSIPKKLPAQLDSDSYGVFICRYADMLMRRKCFWGWGTKNIPSFREEMALEIYANSVPADS
ncbi:hypothetical protein Ddye_032344 [Dipteronia dyeriana]|uniref:Ubiquitin-like protease family profile domain-containing protein n=1 Tax=Dipteronia dyeriana TaxID=168575 RepID=A0AAD9TK18_9ROSI|nr:hypothetical protein Ddye_032344 [Dipteronia dyeriana]